MGIRLSRLLVVPHWDISGLDYSHMRVVATKCLDHCLSPNSKGLPKHMRENVCHLAVQVLEGEWRESWWPYTMMCLMAVQERPGNEEPAAIYLRRELEDIFFYLLYGSHP